MSLGYYRLGQAYPRSKVREPYPRYRRVEVIYQQPVSYSGTAGIVEGRGEVLQATISAGQSLTTGIIEGRGEALLSTFTRGLSVTTGITEGRGELLATSFQTGQSVLVTAGITEGVGELLQTSVSIGLGYSQIAGIAEGKGEGLLSSIAYGAILSALITEGQGEVLATSISTQYMGRKKMDLHVLSPRVDLQQRRSRENQPILPDRLDLDIETHQYC